MDELIKKNIEKFNKQKDLYSKNNAEIAVRAHLIEPILNALGWITSDPEYVLPDLRTKEMDIPDYTLMKNGETALYIEAKKITDNLKSHIGQLARYCTNQGVEYGILTDGMKWILFKSFEKGKTFQERIIWEIDFQKDKIEDINIRLNSISYDNFQNLKVLSEKHDKLLSAWEKAISNPSIIRNAIIDFIKSGLENYKHSFNQSEIENFVDSRLKDESHLFQKNISNEDVSFINARPSAQTRIPNKNKGRGDSDVLKDQIIPVIKQTRKYGHNYFSKACSKIADELNIANQSVYSNCTRRLGYHGIGSKENLLKHIENGEIKEILKRKFPSRQGILDREL